MEGILRFPGALAAEYRRAHPHVEIPPPVGGIWHAWIPDGDGGGAEAHAPGEDELIAKLDGA